MENPNKIEIEGLKTIHKLCNFGAEHDMEGCSFTEIVERMFSKIKSMQTQVNTLDEMLLNQGDALAEAKAQAVQEGFVLVPVDQLNQWGHMANYAEQYGCPECFEARGYAHTLTCEINEYFAIEAQEPAPL